MVAVYCRQGCGNEVVAFNDTLLSAAVDLVSAFEGPCIIAGDFNDHRSKFQSLQRIWDSGWRDLAVVVQERHGLQPQNTCKNSSRHSFVLGNPALLPLVSTVQVETFLELDAHDPIVVQLDVPQCIGFGVKLVRPANITPGDVILCPETKTIADEHQYADVALAIQQENLDSALALWSRAAENCLFESLRPDKHHLAGVGDFGLYIPPEPRLKAGRPGDFQLAGDTPTLMCRQRLRQCRRLQTLCRLVSKDTLDDAQIACTWRAILTAPGFKPNFLVS